MKHHQFFAAVILSLFTTFLSCQKNSGTPSNNDESSITFTKGNIVYKLSATSLRSVDMGTNNQAYWLEGADTNNRVAIVVNTGSIREGTYICKQDTTIGSEAEVGGVYYVSIAQSVIQTTITQVQNGKADGSFSVSGMADNQTHNKILDISQGTFKNIPIVNR